MRIFLGLLVVLAVAGGVFTYHKSEKPAPVSTAITPSAQASATTRQPSQQNWAKRSLDRAGEVRRQVAEQQKEHEAE